jgi:hypothetical protein
MPYRLLTITGLVCLLASISSAATLEKLSLEEMTQKSTIIVRGRVSGCAGELRGSLIYTRCQVAVTERWKGQAASQVDFVVPGGSAAGMKQIFTGTPKFGAGEEYVLFLWSGRSNLNHVIGLSQGAFDLKSNGKGGAVAQRAATSEVMLDKSGQPVEDTPVQMGVDELRRRVRQVLEAQQ